MATDSDVSRFSFTLPTPDIEIWKPLAFLNLYRLLLAGVIAYVLL